MSPDEALVSSTLVETKIESLALTKQTQVLIIITNHSIR